MADARETRYLGLGWRKYIPQFTWAGPLRSATTLLHDAGRECRWYGVSIGQCGVGFLIAWKVEE